MHAAQDEPLEDAPDDGTALPGAAGDPGLVADTVLGTEGAPSPLAVAEGTTPLLEMDRLDVGTPVADLGTEQVSRG